MSELGEKLIHVVVAMSSNYCADLAEAETLIQELRKPCTVYVIEKWIQSWKITINIEKCKAIHFTMWSTEANWRPNLTINGQPLKYCESPTFLGLTLDRQLTFKQHVARIKKIEPRPNTLRSLTGKSWDARRKTSDSIISPTSKVQCSSPGTRA
ncbi:RNA-directed DNA polymerase from mobile element jockey [Elysia marginata]|uniref:RNA-directed DNA polymerase from mobile element jockey n=1 Tax=Elysia marginata TaxID=1093978 RepID=A0AAV4GU08_9GAST|nr:RNA-directed DNA polymerase from mobile element jockey [Elysia marginata]